MREINIKANRKDRKRGTELTNGVVNFLKSREISHDTIEQQSNFLWHDGQKDKEGKKVVRSLQ